MSETSGIPFGRIIFRGGSNPKRCCVIETATGRCVNVTMWDKDAEPGWHPGPGLEPVFDDERQIDLSPPVVPTTVTKLQIRNALKAMGRWEEVRAAIQADDDLQEEWELAREIDRNNPLVLAVAAAFGMDDAALDALFLSAAG